MVGGVGFAARVWRWNGILLVAFLASQDRCDG